MEEKLKNTFDRLSPSEEQSKHIWENIQKQSCNHKNQAPHLNRVKRIAAVFILFIAISSFTMAFSANSSLAEIKEKVIHLFSLGKADKERVDQGMDYSIRLGYAPDILYMDQTYLMFATPQGLVLYDHRNDRFVETLDLLEIDCIYFDSMDIHTRAAISDDRIIVYNEKDGNLYGDYYIYHIPENANEENISYEIANDPKIFEKFSAEMISSKIAAVDTFEFFIDIKKNQKVTRLLTSEKDSDPSGPNLFSEYSYPLMDDTKVTSYHFLYQEGAELFICSVDSETGNLDRKALKLSMEDNSPEGPGDNDVYQLPLFNCSLGDAALDAICEYMNTNIWYLYQQPSDGIAIPAFHICKEKELHNGKLFIGFFSNNTVVKNGDLLEVIGGNHIPAQIQLEKTDLGYAVTRANFARDGATYYEDLKAFAAGDEVLYQAMAHPDNIDELTRSIFIDNLTLYLKENNIYVTYLLGFDNDPYKLSE